MDQETSNLVKNKIDQETLNLVKNKIDQLENQKTVPTERSITKNDLNTFKDQLKGLSKKEIKDSIRLVANQLNMKESDVQQMISTFV